MHTPDYAKLHTLQPIHLHAVELPGSQYVCSKYGRLGQYGNTARDVAHVRPMSVLIDYSAEKQQLRLGCSCDDFLGAPETGVRLINLYVTRHVSCHRRDG